MTISGAVASLAFLLAGPITAAEVSKGLAQIPDLREELNRELLDYRSARFRDVYVTAQGAFDEGHRGGHLCGFVSSRSRNSGDVGWTAFVAIDGYLVFSDSDLGNTLLDDLCGPNDPRDHVDRSALLQRE